MNSLPAIKLMFLFICSLLHDNSLHSILLLKILASPSSVEPISSDRAAQTAQALNKELCFQWYIPPLERPPKETEPMVCNIITELNLTFRYKV